MTNPAHTPEEPKGFLARLCDAVFPTLHRDQWIAEFAESHAGRVIQSEDNYRFAAAAEVQHDGIAVQVGLGVTPGRMPREFLLVQCTVQPKQEFSFKLADQTYFHDGLELLGFYDVQIGKPEIDKRFLIRTQQPELMKVLLEDARVRELIEDMRYGRVTMLPKKDTPGHSEIVFDLSDAARSAADVENNFGRFTALLDRLKMMGVI